MEENTNSTRLKIGIIGCGKMGKHHMRAISLQKNAEISAIADPFADIDDLGDFIPAKATIFTSAEELLNKTDIDVIHIVTPPSTHAELALLALNNDTHIYVEKPLALHKAEAENIYSLAQKKRLSVCAGHQVLFESSAKVARESLEEIGKLVHIESYFSFRTVRKNIVPVDQLFDILPHPTALLLDFMECATSIQPTLDALSVDPKGEVRAQLHAGETYGSLIVSLQGRPVESYLRLVGTNGSLFADFVRGTVIKLPGPGASAVSVVYNTYSQALQNLWKPTWFFARQALKKHSSYPGLGEIIKTYYTSISNQSSFSQSPSSTLATVACCEEIYHRLKKAEFVAENTARIIRDEKEKSLPEVTNEKNVVLVTGGTGMLGCKVAEELRLNKHKVRILARKIPPYSKQLPGVEYITADLGETIPTKIFSDVSMIVHCAAETAGGKKEHDRNTILATTNLIQRAAECGVRQIIHISSIAVLKPSKKVGSPLDESTQIDANNISRGPYVWSKANAELEAEKLDKELDVTVKVIRLGPLIDFTSFQAPGRLGKEVGPLFIAVGSKKYTLSLCDVLTAAKVIRYYTEHFQEVPQILNLIEPAPPTRGDLISLLKKERTDLKCIWLPFFILKLASPALTLLQRVLLPKNYPINLIAVFSSESYDTNLANEIITKAYEGIKDRRSV